MRRAPVEPDGVRVEGRLGWVLTLSSDLDARHFPLKPLRAQHLVLKRALSVPLRARNIHNNTPRRARLIAATSSVDRELVWVSQAQMAELYIHT